jgi:hypothetical protein
MDRRSLEQRADEWIGFRKTLFRDRVEGERVILLHRTAVDPSYLAEPLRSEVMRRLAAGVKHERLFTQCLILDLPD